MTSNSIWQRLVSSLIFSILIRTPFLRRKFVKSLSQLGVNYVGSSVVEDDAGWWWRWWGIGPKAGERAYDGEVEGGKRVLDVLSGGDLRHVLLAFVGKQGVDVEVQLAGLLDQEAYKHVIKAVAVMSGGSGKAATAPAGWEVVYDQQGTLHKLYGGSSSRTSLYLIRPDGYVGYRCQGLSGKGLGLFLRRQGTTGGKL